MGPAVRLEARHRMRDVVTPALLAFIMLHIGEWPPRFVVIFRPVAAQGL